LPTGDYGFSSQQSLWQFVSLPNLCAPGLFLESLARRAFSLVTTMSRLWDRCHPLFLLGNFKMTEQPMSIKQIFSSAFQLSKDAARIKSALELHLAKISPGRDHQLLHFCHRNISDWLVAMGHIEHQIVATRAINKHL
jgi:hypothetical protein